MKHSRAGYSLIELLVVLAIMSILSFVAIGNIRFSANVTTTGLQVRDAINLARNIAITRNQTVQVRFYQIPTGSGSLAYGGFQTYAIADDNVAQAADQFVTLPMPIILDSTSTLLNGSAGMLTGTAPVPGLGSTTYNYTGFTFRPDGSTTLAANTANGDTWYIMVRSQHDQSTPPKDYVVVQVDPVSGYTTTITP